MVSEGNELQRNKRGALASGVRRAQLHEQEERRADCVPGRCEQEQDEWHCRTSVVNSSLERELDWECRFQRN